MERFGGFRFPLNPDSFVALFNFVPGRDDPTDGFYKAFVKYPKVSYTKKPILFLQAGSNFRVQPVKKMYGSCVENIAFRAYTIAIPCCLA